MKLSPKDLQLGPKTLANSENIVNRGDRFLALNRSGAFPKTGSVERPQNPKEPTNFLALQFFSNEKESGDMSELCAESESVLTERPGSIPNCSYDVSYRAPEIIAGSGRYDEKVDVWSVGCIFAELLYHTSRF